MSRRSTRSNLYRAARLLGDLDAVERGRYTQRLVRKRAYRGTFSVLARLLR